MLPAAMPGTPPSGCVTPSLRCVPSPHSGVLPPIPQQSRLRPSAVARWRGDGKHQSTAPVALQEGKSDTNVNADLRERGFFPPSTEEKEGGPAGPGGNSKVLGVSAEDMVKKKNPPQQ